MVPKSDPIFAPIEFWLDDKLLSGADSQALPQGTQIITDLEQAMLLENSQDLPPGYRIWADAIPAALSPFYSTAKSREGEEMIEAQADEVLDARGDFELDLNKKRTLKTITEAEEFWLTVGYDILEALKAVALARYVQGGEPFLEKLFAVYRAGFYPCGLDDKGNLAAFDPRVLTR